MEISEYQAEASRTDQARGTGESGLVIALLGLAGEAGSLLTEYKKHFRDGEAYRIFPERIEEELGDLLWYIANVATKSGLDLGNVARENLRKVRDRWAVVGESPVDGGIGAKLFDEGYQANEQLPREFRVEVNEVSEGGRIGIVATHAGSKFGQPLTDNAYEDDGYRFHDAFHLGYAAVLGWSPVTRRNFDRKRRSHATVDEVEDGGRAIAIEEGIAALVFSYAAGSSFFDGVSTIDYSLLRTIKDLTAHLEVKRASMKEWEKAILGGFGVWRTMKERRGGIIHGNLRTRAISYEVRA